MGLKSKKILGISITIDSKKTILEYIEKYLEKSSEKPLHIATPNPEQIVYAQKDKHFLEILNQADVAIPDGIGLALAIRVKRIPGVELMEDLVKLAAIRGYGVGLIGGRGNIAVEALECLIRKFPSLSGWAFEPGEIDLGNLGNLREKIQKTKTRLVFVGLGAPKQEYYIARLARDLSLRGASLGATRQSLDLPAGKAGIASPSERSRNDGVVLMAVGGSFDIISGRTPRAPWIVRNMGLEWLWRLIREPWRWRRQLALVKFIWMIVREKLVSKCYSSTMAVRSGL